MFLLQTLSIPSNQLPAVNHRLPTPLFAVRRRLASVRCRSATVEGFGARVVSYRNQAPASLYDVLRVKHNATPTDIKKAYRRLAKVHHPDAAASSEDPVGGGDFIQIHNAYETLSDPKTRAVYDRSIGRRRMMTRSATLTTSFGGNSSSPRSSPMSSPRSPNIRFGGRFYPTRRWESDQCW